MDPPVRARPDRPAAPPPAVNTAAACASVAASTSRVAAVDWTTPSSPALSAFSCAAVRRTLDLAAVFEMADVVGFVDPGVQGVPAATVQRGLAFARPVRRLRASSCFRRSARCARPFLLRADRIGLGEVDVIAPPAPVLPAVSACRRRFRALCLPVWGFALRSPASGLARGEAQAQQLVAGELPQVECGSRD